MKRMSPPVGVRQAGDDAGFTGLEFGFADTSAVQGLLAPLPRVTRFAGLAPAKGGGGAADGADLAFEFTHAGFVGVVTDDFPEGNGFEVALIGFEAFSSSCRGTR